LKTGLKLEPALGLAAVVHPGKAKPESGKVPKTLFPKLTGIQ
jgi:hypothetical protein